MEKYDHKYGAEQIQVLDGLEHVRKRPGMYIGSVSVRGLHHCVYEIVDNAVDEALAGYCKNIHVTIEPGNVICVEDDGRGIPVDIHKKPKISAAEIFVLGCISTGIPLPSSSTLIIFPFSIVTLIFLQYPANASSTELSTISYTK